VSLSSPFIKRPVATSLLAAAFLLVGIVSYFQLPVSALPQVDFPTLQVSANLPGASPETMASNVATPLERQLSLIAGITQMTSSSQLGSANIVLQFELTRNIDGAAQDVQAAISAAGGQLPSTLPSPPTVRKVNPADTPVLVLSLRSDTLPIAKVSDYADSIAAQQISRIEGVGLVNIYGQRKPAIRIQIDPRKVASLGLQLDSIRAAIANNTVNAPKGSLAGPDRNLTIYANDQILDIGPWRNLVVAYKNGAPVRVKDIGQAIQDVENNQTGAQSFPGRASRDVGLPSGPTILLAITKQPGANVLRTVETIKKALPAIQANMPASIDMHIVQDRTQTIKASVKDVEMTLLITIVLVVGVIFLFLRNVRATIIPSAVIPLSLLATAAVMLPAGFSLDNLSLMALTIAVGFVVDDAIVMVEAIWRRIEHGEKPFQAALNGAGEISFTILSIAISLIAVFTPLMFMSGVVGRLMREFALTLSASVVLSVILSLTFTPMLCGRFLKPPMPPRSRIMKGLESGFLGLERGYARGHRRRVRRHRPAVRLALCDRPHGLLPAAGHRLHPGHDHHRPGLFLLQGRPEGRRGDEDRRPGQGCGGGAFQRRRQSQPVWPELRPAPARGRPHRLRGPDHGPLAAPIRSGGRRPGGSTSTARHQHRRPGRPGAISIHAVGRGSGRAQYLGAQAARCDDEAASAQGRQFRPAIER
jgi:HAE1 family hydrophobic/amphiphilic exporter-1